MEEWATPDERSPDYCQFASGWYQGYGSSVIVELTAGSKGASAGVPSASVVRRVLDDAADALPSAQRLRHLSEHDSKTGLVTQRLAIDRGSHLEDVTPQLRTAGANAQAVKRFDDVDAAILNRLDASQRTGLLRLVGDDPDGIRLVNELGSSGDAVFDDAAANSDCWIERGGKRGAADGQRAAAEVNPGPFAADVPAKAMLLRDG